MRFLRRLDTGQYQAARRYVERETRSVPRTRYDFGSPPPSQTIGGLPGSHSNLTFAGNQRPAGGRKAVVSSGVNGAGKSGITD